MSSSFFFIFFFFNDTATTEIYTLSLHDALPILFFLERKGFSGEQDQWIEDGAPADLVIVERIVKMARPDGVLRKDQRAVLWIPDGKSPISEELRKAVSSPPFVSSRDD